MLTWAGRAVQQHIPHAHSDTFPGESAASCQVIWFLIQHLLKGEAAIGIRWHRTYRLGFEG